MNLQWIKRFSKSFPFYIFITNLCIGILINLASGLYCLVFDDVEFSFNRILKTFLVTLVPTYIIFPTLIARLYFDFKYRNDTVKNNKDDWYEDIYDKIIIYNIIGFAIIVVLILVFHNRGYTYPDYFDSYWDTY